ncbi:hypothetical protein BABINDRAFT_171167 [Babjeviella inositovora NRRL Y-12698]|uniref:Palmitoyltransferase n=1 Tax=Babjeviella inositovora NRRL Y-12698 TaxID=984486 RepID=A0A1E3QQX7_9ASCO|nr:uncharacterized protein BABINDRAFT_171167 [Babjeviella inositovora NRRL Y-12698]ODQ80116.1 hypothetical protein BABINDRAFT_171167 [Babjeviella inositovora NRRL Y-12698]
MPIMQSPQSPEESNPTLKSFMAACQTGNLPTVKDLAAVCATETFPDNITGLHWAAINNRLSVVQYLAESYPEILDVRGGDLDATPLHWACRYGLVYIADYLIKQGADPARCDSQGFNCLHLAINSSNIMLVIYILNTTDIHVDTPDPNRRTALGWAAYQGDTLSVEVCLQHGADVAQADDQGFTPLHWSYMRGTFPIIKQLLEHGADVNNTTYDGKSSFDIARDMNCLPTLKNALYETGRDRETGLMKPKLMGESTAKVATFFAPYVMLGVALAGVRLMETSDFLRLFAVFPVLALLHFLTMHLLVPNYLRTHQNALLKTPYLAGVFSASFFYCVVVWVTHFAADFLETPLAHIFFVLSAAAVYGLFSKAMFINPGYIHRPASKTDTQGHIMALMAIGKYDAQHFCIHTMVRKPLRAKYSEHSRKLIAGFDHYCPWLYNEVGVRNHKLFVGFILALEVAALCFLHLALESFDELPSVDECAVLGESLCRAATHTPFALNLFFWTCFQLIWLSFLIFTQLFQISRGLTTYEASKLYKKDHRQNPYYASVPEDLAGLTETPVEDPLPKNITLCGSFSRLLGLDQFVSAARDATSSRHQEIATDYGVKMNCLDFWFIGDTHNWRNIFYLPIDGEHNINGRTVDYYHLYKLPSKDVENLV